MTDTVTNGIDDSCSQHDDRGAGWLADEAETSTDALPPAALRPAIRAHGCPPGLPLQPGQQDNGLLLAGKKGVIPHVASLSKVELQANTNIMRHGLRWQTGYGSCSQHDDLGAGNLADEAETSTDACHRLY